MLIIIWLNTNKTDIGKGELKRRCTNTLTAFFITL